jgi:tetratricopeptide (TPR) repeat protein
VEKDDILGSLKGGLGLAGKLAAKGASEMAGIFKHKEDAAGAGETGLYYQRRPSAGQLLPGMEFFESQTSNRLSRGLVKNLTSSRAERAFVQACYALVTGGVEEALDRLRETASRDAQFTDAYFLMGCVHLEGGEAGEATANFQKALLCQQSLGQRLRRFLPSFRMSLPLTPYSTLALYADLLGLNVLLALAQREAGRTADAVRTLEQLLGVLPADPVTLFFLNLMRLELGRYRQVVDALRELLPDSNLLVADLLLLGVACCALGDPITAREIYRKALQKGDLDPVLELDLRHYLGEALIAEGWPRDAEEEFRQIQARDAHYQPLLARLGVTLGEPAGRSQPAAPAPEPAPASPPPPRAAGAPEAPGAETAPPGGKPPSLPTTVIAEPPLPMGPARLVSEGGEVDVPLGPDPVLIGREEGDIVLRHDTAISRVHARVTHEGGSWWVEDLSSTNGTWVNGHRISRRVELHRGDVVQVGQTVLRVR